jgi:Zn-dependent peptidase ImmA (M78 family)/DNA-binding XRE family transcriptional regulator
MQMNHRTLTSTCGASRPEGSPAPTFEPSRLTVARQRRGLSKTELAEQVQLTPRSISAFEAGEAPPSPESVAAISAALRFPEPFFFGEPVDFSAIGAASFRSLKSATAWERHAARASGALAIDIARWLRERFEFPTGELPNLGDLEPEAAAITLRQLWGLGNVPAPNMVHLLESRGIHVFSLAPDCRTIDAFSTWIDGLPHVFLNTLKSAEHGRYDAAHELGHLVMHRHGEPSGRVAESDANAFASAFLMPKDAMIPIAPRLPTVDVLRKLKVRWRVSVSALAYRFHALKLSTEWQYRMTCIEISRRNYRTHEPDGVARETSQAIDKALEQLRSEGLNRSAVAAQLNLSLTDFNSLTFAAAALTTPIRKA